MRTVTCTEVEVWAEIVAGKLEALDHSSYLLAGIPRGGIPAAYAIGKYLTKPYRVVSTEDDLSAVTGTLILVDDIYFSGKSMDAAFAKHAHAVTFAVLALKTMAHYVTGVFGVEVPLNSWVQFPWETKDEDLGKPEDAVIRLIEYLGDDPTRDGLLETPRRFLKFLDEQRIGETYEATTFKSDITDLQVENGIPFGALCEHHILPYFGKASVGYIPSGKLLGLSKLVRITAEQCQGLTMQEVMTAQVASAVQNAAGTEDVAVITTAQHTCMLIRGVKAYGASMSSSAMLGKFRDFPALRAEFMALAGIS